MALFGIVVLLLAWVAFYLIRAQGVMTLVLSAVVLAGAVLLWRSGASRLVPVVAALTAVAGVLFVVTLWHSLWVALQVGAVIVAVACIAPVIRSAARRARRAHPALRVTSTVGGGIGIALVAVLSIFVLVTSVSANALMGVGGYLAGSRNSFQPEGPAGKQTRLSTGVLRTSDVEYAKKYPNSFLDVYTNGASDSADRPTYVYVHGGGWVGGSKSTGDPNAGPSAGFGPTYIPALKAGYNMVSVGYAFAPEYKYPTALEQVSEAIAFLQQHGDEYGLSMDRVVVGGGSAGGQITGQFANIQTNPAYAKQVGIKPVIGSALKAMVLDSPALDLNRIGQTEAPVLALDFAYNNSGRAYAGDSRSRWAEANVIDHVTKNYPATFLSDGNTGTFPDQSFTMNERLEKLGVRSEVYVPPLSDGVVGHAQQVNNTPRFFVEEYNARKYRFLQSVIDAK